MNNQKRIQILDQAIKLLEDNEEHYMCYAIALAYVDVEEIHIDSSDIPESTALPDYVIDSEFVSPYKLFPELKKYCYYKIDLRDGMPWEFANVNGEIRDVDRQVRIEILNCVKNEIQEEG